MPAARAYALLSLSWLLSGPQEATIWVLARAGAMGVLGCGTLLAGQALIALTVDSAIPSDVLARIAAEVGAASARSAHLEL